ncbi:hypothetical protein GCM10007276_32880 [Agaricicola taiwanensis]|uniref:Amine oxidase domain-containing protein n=1 Tax=Agaricicola taiwanensis TaxID=591372 RepID=A0A8J2YLX4_9RHOB|nr:FAD-dependent oxidoreductase [Agaricicola taiwanensis]GGE53258.1 hypothetical protein GCM10007276_32880 [Agaricicola taiwanensis]
MSRHVAIIGAGIAGLACGRRLTEAGCTVVIYERNPGLGGRCGTCRIDGMVFDHGAQYATAQSDAFRSYLMAARERDQAARWPEEEHERQDDREAYVGIPGMSTLAGGLAPGADVRLKTEVTSLLHTAKGWAVGLANGDAEGCFSSVVLAVPAPRAISLLPEHPFRQRLETVRYAPCWAGLAAFGEALEVPDIVETGGPIQWAARNNSKRGRPDVECWVMHASVPWSRDRLEEEESVIALELLETFGMQIGGTLPQTLHLSAHRWRHARVEHPLGEDFLHDEEWGIGVCGDGCIGPRVESAFLSGDALGRAMAGGGR